MASYTQINAETMANVITASTVAGIAKEQKWVLKAHVESRGRNPFTNFIGGYRGGKPIIEVMETNKLAGDTINLHRLAPLGGPGRQGEASRDGQEEKYRFSNYQFTIGRLWNGTAQNAVTRDQTVIGSNFDREANSLLAEWMGWHKGTDVEASMIVAQHSRNTFRPNFKSTREALRTADYLTGETVIRAQNGLSSLQAKGLVAAKSKAGQEVYKYLLVSNQYALSKFKSTSTYTNILANAQVRGDGNELFAGGLPDWNGNMLWEWQVPDHTAFGPVGSLCVPRAFLGAAVTAGTATFDITGGGSAAGAALTTPLYFQNFSNAAYTGFEGVKIAASTGTTRYVGIMNLSGSDAGKVGFYSYTVNTGNVLTVAGRLGSAASGIRATTLGNVTWDVAPWTVAANGPFAGLTDAHPVGSLIFETNSYGVPFGLSYMMADEAVMSGYGSIDGKVSAMGQRTEARGPHNLDYGIGLELCWGCLAIPRVDGIAGGYAIIESAIDIPGLPDITAA